MAETNALAYPAMEKCYLEEFVNVRACTIKHHESVIYKNGQISW
jgi:hypothetical protein